MFAYPIFERRFNCNIPMACTKVDGATEPVETANGPAGITPGFKPGSDVLN
jgi:hypothetical protein